KHIPREVFLRAGQLAGIKPEEFDHFTEFVVCDELSRCGSGGVSWGLTG
ncbi:19856_t:CDS:2, partial [Entrophospora sp. SA101]